MDPDNPIPQGSRSGTKTHHSRGASTGTRKEPGSNQGPKVAGRGGGQNGISNPHVQGSSQGHGASAAKSTTVSGGDARGKSGNSATRGNNGNRGNSGYNSTRGDGNAANLRNGATGSIGTRTNSYNSATRANGNRGSSGSSATRGNGFTRGNSGSSATRGSGFTRGNLGSIGSARGNGYHGNSEYNSTRGSETRGNLRYNANAGGGRGHYSSGSDNGFSRRNAQNWGANNRARLAVESEMVSATKLKELLDKDADEVVMHFNESGNSFVNVIRRKFKDEESLKLFVQILGEKFCTASALQSIRNALVSKVCIPEFLDQLKDLTFQLLIKGSTPATAQLLVHLYSFYKFVGDKMPNMAADNLIPLVQAAAPIIKSITSGGAHGELEELSSKYSLLQDQLEEFKKKRDEEMKVTGGSTGDVEFQARLERRRREFERRWMEPPPDDYRSLPLIPTAQELLSGAKAFLRPGLTKGQYPSVHDYLDVNFRLLREDFVDPLREGIQDFYKTKEGKTHRKPAHGTVKIYRHVKLLPGLIFNTSSPSHTVQLEMTPFLRNIKWDRTKRLLGGSLLLFTQDDFGSIFFATVSRRDVRDLTTRRTFCITWEGRQPDFQPNSYWDMLECDVFYETYRHTLKALREMNEGTFPMLKYIIQASSEKIAPPYLTFIAEKLDFKILMSPDAVEDLRSADSNYGFANLLDPSDWPSAPELGMDNSQYEAFQAAMTQEFSIIQGPPGTGKTFIGIQIAKFLLANKQHFLPQKPLSREHEEREVNTNTPVLVVCFTNHALDQFLEAIHGVMLEMDMKPEDELVRVGGRSKSETMKELMMYQRLEDAVTKRTLPESYLRKYASAKGSLNTIKHTRYTILEVLRSLTQLEGIANLWELQRKLPTGTGQFRLEHFVKETISAMNKCKNPRAQFGLDGKIYSLPDFNIYRRIGGIFNFKVPEEPVPPAASEQGPCWDLPEAGEGDEEEGEDYDLEELTANRMEELSYEVTELDGRKVAIPYILGPYHFSQDYHSNRIKLEACQQVLQDAKAPVELLMQTETEAVGLEFKIRKSENVRKLIAQIIYRHGTGQLQLPTVTNAMLINVKTRMESGEAREREHWRETWSVYFHCVAKLREALLKEVVKLEDHLLDLTRKFKDVENYGYAQILQKVKFVGATTTGAAKYNSILKLIKSKMVIVEEAAEVLESQIVTSITKHCQHLVLIGDHFQLRPKTTVYRLGKDYNLDISLFERMINNEMNAHVLEIQHRMRPQICNLLVPTIYNSLVNHESVYKYPDVLGLASNLFFIKHTEPERGEADGMSKSNEHEAKFLARLCRHLILQGYSHDRITILTTYVGQMFLIKKIINKDEPSCVDVRVTVVDNFQGEENDIILLSLVRSNEENKIGFLSTDNRICVAISRAKHGFYVIGNMDSMESNSSTWKLIREKLEAKDNIGTSLALKCAVHGEVTKVTNPSDFSNAPEGGCLRMCESLLDNCSHICRLVCHVKDRDHTEYDCRFPCDRKCVKNGHGCVGLCYQDPCPLCRVIVETLLKCGHSVKLACHVDTDLYKCTISVERHLPCTHDLEMPCHEDPQLATCYEFVLKTLPCSHEQLTNCYMPVEDIKCRTLDTVTIPDCKHKLTLPCHKAQLPPETWDCISRCDTRLDCGHSCVTKCHFKNDPNHDNYKCQKECARFCPNEHKCMQGFQHKHKCHSSCPPCCIPFVTVLPCSHETTMPCNESRDETAVAKFKCKVEVVKQSVDCAHEIPVPCSVKAERKLCNTKVDSKILSACGHPVQVPCSIQDTVTPEGCVAYCEEPCGQVLSLDGVGCEHLCSGTCSSCYNGRMHEKCQNTCGRILICGEPCTSPCSQVCPPCRRQCSMSCEHSNCRKPCGEPCTPCKEPCSWKCPHAQCTNLCGEECNREPCDVPCTRELECGHTCAGFCGELCPPCVVCNKELTEFNLGHEDEEDARFVTLEDCHHTLEVRDLNRCMNTESDDMGSHGILVRRCPLCGTIVRRSRRYGKILKACMKDVMQVKTKIFGGTKITQNQVRELGQRFESVEKGSKAESELIFFGNYIRIFIFKIPPPKRGDRFKKVDQYTLESLSHMMNWWEDACVDKTKLLESLRKDLIIRYIRMFRIVKTRGVPLSQLEIKQFNMEFRRLADIFQLYRRGSTEIVRDPTFPTPGYDKVKETVLAMRPYTRHLEAQFKTELTELDGVLRGKSVEFAEIQHGRWKAAFDAISATATSWYRCFCGHLYAVGDCGHLNESMACPKCKSLIGGGSGNAMVTDSHRVPVLHIPAPVPEVFDFTQSS